MHNSPISRLTLHATWAEQVASPEIFAYCTGKRECVEVVSAHRGGGEQACMHKSPMCRLTLHATRAEQVALPEIVADCTGKRE
jgi:hypothetical protein